MQLHIQFFSSRTDLEECSILQGAVLSLDNQFWTLLIIYCFIATVKLPTLLKLHDHDEWGNSLTSLKGPIEYTKYRYLRMYVNNKILYSELMTTWEPVFGIKNAINFQSLRILINLMEMLAQKWNQSVSTKRTGIRILRHA